MKILKAKAPKVQKINKPPIENAIYAALIGVCEAREHSGAYKGNGHHLAQLLTRKVVEGLLPKQLKKIYAVLTTNPKLTGQIAKETGVASKTISSHLLQLQKKHLLIGSKKEGQKISWYKLWSDEQ